jgi:hypothetical protein
MSVPEATIVKVIGKHEDGRQPVDVRCPWCDKLHRYVVGALLSQRVTVVARCDQHRLICIVYRGLR